MSVRAAYRRAAVLTSSVLFGVNACNVVGTSTSSGPPPITLDDFFSRQIPTICEQKVRCGFFPDQATCEASTIDDGPWRRQEIDAGRMRFDGMAASACLAAIAAGEANAGCGLTALNGSGPPSACVATFKGTLADQAPCFVSEECASGSCNGITCPPITGATCCPGKCGPRPGSPVGASCAFDGDCVDSAYCLLDLVRARSTCVPRGLAGSSCGVDRQCADGSLCVNGTCGVLPGPGETCERLCDSIEDYCDPMTRQCVPIHSLGDVCGLPLQECGVQAYCTFTISSVCNAKSINSVCETADECFSNQCFAGRCSTNPPAFCP